MVSSSNRLAPVLEVAHVLRSTLVAQRVPTVRAVTAGRSDSNNTGCTLLCWSSFGGIAQEEVNEHVCCTEAMHERQGISRI